MKIAAGCFGCLAFVFLGLAVTLIFGMNAIATALPPDVADVLLGLSAPLTWVSEGCCCLSGVLAIILLAVGSMGKKEETYE